MRSQTRSLADVCVDLSDFGRWHEQTGSKSDFFDPASIARSRWEYLKSIFLAQNVKIALIFCRIKHTFEKVSNLMGARILLKSV